ncbi:Intradiol ring-cleavage dioxygenase [Xylariaceae sp. FL0804]|nr:Intradiol ring-cleavage dioxygenase [Xylariaceae sp. FL0804]
MAPRATDASNQAQLSTASRFDPTFTQHVIDAMGPKTSPRNRVVLGALLRYLHDFSREPNGRACLMHGLIRDWVTGKPIEGAVLDIWQASANGKYDFQDPENLSPNNLRSKFSTDTDGKYWFYCYHPTAYSLPRDGPAHKLFGLMDHHSMRPAHIHIMVMHPDYKRCTTQLYPSEDPYLESDTVFAVKKDLVIDFKPLEGDSRAEMELDSNVILAPKDYKGSAY